MTDEPENMTLALLRGIRAEQEHLASMLGKVADAVTAVAATQDHHSQILTRHSEILEHHSIAVAAVSADLKETKATVEDVSERLQMVEGRLNTIDGRLARIEKHTGLVKA